MASQPTTTIRERPPQPFEPRTINFELKEINKWIYENIESLKKRLNNLHKNEIPRYRRIVDGKPREKNKSWPFPNCANLVAPLAAEAVEETVAWVLQLIYVTQPLCTFRYPNGKDEEEAKKNSDLEKALGNFFDDAAFDPRQLNLYPYHNAWLVDAASLGKARLCVAPEERIEAVYAGYKPADSIGKKGAAAFEEETLYQGPKLINLRFEDILCGTDAGDGGQFEDNDPIFRRCILNKRKIRERTFKGHFLEAEAKKILDTPDRYGPDEVRKRENQKKGITDEEDPTMAEWDIYEGYFSWFHNGIKFRLIAWYHLKTKTMLNCVYNFIPKNQIPIIEARLSSDGKGFGEMLEGFQEEVSTAKNQRIDAISFGTLGINTIDKQNKDLDRNFTLFPGITLPAKRDTFQHYDMANPAFAGLSLENENAMIQQAKMRAGVDPPIAGAGAGSANKKGQFGSMGTMAVLQTSNSRSAHRTSGFRYASVRLYSLVTDICGMMGCGDSELVKRALNDYLSGKIKIPVRAADASMNKEVTKQNEIILNQAYAAYIKQTSSLLQAYQNPAASAPGPDGVDIYKKWLRATIIGNTRMFQKILTDFQLSDNPAEFAPDIELPEQKPEQPQNAQAQAGGPTDIRKMAELLRGRGQGGGITPTPAMGGAGGGPEGQSGAIG